MSKIGLCMIVKNESKIISRCLDSVKPLIDYVYIHDTGSSDDTIKVIEKWCKENNIDREVKSVKWQDFAYNRSKALEGLRDKKFIDYALIIDADEILTYDTFNIKNLKNNLIADLYNIVCKFGNIIYNRTSLIRNSKPWYYRGVLHEFLDCKEDISTKCTLPGIYNIPIQDSARNQLIASEKYKKDAIVLEEAIKTEADEFLKTRYYFYLAQSYRDCGKHEKALNMYLERVKRGDWAEEQYISLYNAAKLKQTLNYKFEDILQTYLDGYEKVPTRIECLHGAVQLCRASSKNHQAYIIASHAIQLKINYEGLFVQKWIWGYGIKDEFSIAAYWSGHYEEGLKAAYDIVNLVPVEQKPRIEQNIKFLLSKK